VSEIEKAIETLECIYPSKREIATGEYPDVADALDLAIEALREKAEREKGCEYCTTSKQITIKSHGEMVGFAFIKPYKGKKCLFVCMHNEVEKIDIDFCPHCGRKLKGADHE
jgi:hypothetical protein